MTVSDLLAGHPIGWLHVCMPLPFLLQFPLASFFLAALLMIHPSDHLLLASYLLSRFAELGACFLLSFSLFALLFLPSFEHLHACMPLHRGQNSFRGTWGYGQCTARLWPIWHLILSLGCCTISLPAACTASSCTSSRLDSKLLLVAALKGLLTYT